MFVDKKLVKNFTMPASVWTEFEKIHEKHGHLTKKQKWVVVSSAIVALATMPIDYRNAIVAATVAADASEDGFKKLFEILRSGKFQRDFDEANAPVFEDVYEEKQEKPKKGSSRKHPKEPEQAKSSSPKSH